MQKPGVIWLSSLLGYRRRTVDRYYLANSRQGQRCESDLRAIVRRLMRMGLSSEEIKEYFVTAIPQALQQASVKQPKAGYKKS